MDKTLIIFRHGETDWNKQGLVQGSSNIPLNSKGIEQAKALAKHLKSYGITHIYSSDLDRALTTAGIIAKENVATISHHPELRETHFGDAEGKSRSEIRMLYKDLFAQIDAIENPVSFDISLPGGECRSIVLNRVLPFLKHELHVTNHHVIGISAHGGVMGTICAKLWGIATSFGNCEYLICTYNTETRQFTLIEKYNEIGDRPKK